MCLIFFSLFFYLSNLCLPPFHSLRYIFAYSSRSFAAKIMTKNKNCGYRWNCMTSLYEYCVNMYIYNVYKERRKANIVTIKVMNRDESGNISYTTCILLLFVVYKVSAMRATNKRYYVNTVSSFTFFLPSTTAVPLFMHFFSSQWDEWVIRKNVNLLMCEHGEI